MAAAFGCTAALYASACNFDWTYSPAPDGGGDGGALRDGASSDGPAANFCASPHLFCADFDEGNPVSYGWNMGMAVCCPDKRPTTLELDPKDPKSAPYSVHSAFPASDFQYSGQASLFITFDSSKISAPYNRMQVALDLRVATATALPVLLFSVIQRNGDFCRFGLTVSDSLDSSLGSASLQTEAWGNGGIFRAVEHHPLTIFPLAGIWTHVEMDVDIPAQTVTAKFDGTIATTVNLNPQQCGGIGAAADLLVGADDSYPLDTCGGTYCQAAEVWFDNVTLDVAP